MFRGSATARIDEKGRLKIPTAFRKDLAERYGREIFITSIQGTSALIYPLTVWQEVEDRLSEMPKTNQVKQRYLERVSYFGQQTRVDAQGRVVIPQPLRDRAAMAGEVVVSARLDHLEVWNRERLDKRFEDQPFAEEDFEYLSDQGI